MRTPIRLLRPRATRKQREAFVALIKEDAAECRAAERENREPVYRQVSMTRGESAPMAGGGPVAAAIEVADRTKVHHNSAPRPLRVVPRFERAGLVGASDWPRWTPNRSRSAGTQ
jgi:hypothetical protein